ncbi:helix-turn-helix transcriptional regulator [Kroppenstedtia pulmonis]|uniref:Helix-turn-helix transcriptional regulator n=1 Tax=Kroppenstedtia pulmonis TaxID=1380685 RepID=A0A7D3XJ98_9BACL|nr:helix-turn-helix transcriptional regulator [Kroppenstedtia pulmonis]QKG84699.1 helix-turn-helix transcriptional regulator [Kroppenstedtia pulmonis]
MFPTQLPEVASLLADPSRVIILTTLLDGRFHTAGELAFQAGITPQTVSFHLQKLQSCHMVERDQQGRHSYYRLSSDELAKWLESFLGVLPPPEIRSLRQSTQLKELRKARSCYDHLAGDLGVKILDRLIEYQWLEELGGKKLQLTEEGEIHLVKWGVDVDLARNKRRSFAHRCLDWSERRYHLAGALGCVLYDFFIQQGWVQQNNFPRVLIISKKGEEALSKWLGIRC